MMMRAMSTVDRDLLALRALFSAESAWCAGFQGMDKRGYYIDPLDKNCVRRCILGGMNFISGVEEGPRFHAMVEALGMNKFSLAAHNNRQGRLAVLALIDTAIERTQQS